jgi:putative hydroxymethylpyrimidine transport system substrate-binding protein
VQEGIAYAKSHPKEAFDLFAKSNPEANEGLDREAFRISVPLFASTQVQSKEQWGRWAKFAKEHGLISKAVTVDELIANVVGKQ